MLTIGYGDDNLDVGISKPSRRVPLLRSRIDRMRRDLIASAWPPFIAQPDHVKDALTDMAFYQLGVAKPAFWRFHVMLTLRWLEARHRGESMCGRSLRGVGPWHKETPSTDMCRGVAARPGVSG